MAKLVAVVDDEKDIVELICFHLKREGFKVKEFYDGESMVSWIKENQADLIILDLMLPGIDGLEVCRKIKADERLASIPIIMVTVKGDETDIVVGLEMGADDYIVKPFSPKELVARVKAVLRRIRPSEESALLKIGDLLIDKYQFEVKIRDKKVELTPTEFRLLEILARNKKRVFTRNQLLDRLWEGEKTVVDRTIDVHIARLRKKLGNLGNMIKSVPGIGYKMEA